MRIRLFLLLIFVVLPAAAVVLALVGLIVYLRRKRAGDAAAAVQLGLEHGESRDLAASDPAAAEVLAAAAGVRQAFEAGA